MNRERSRLDKAIRHLAIGFSLVLSLPAWGQEELLQILEKSPAKVKGEPSKMSGQRDQLVRIIGKPNGDQQIFIQHFLNGDNKAALLTYNDAFRSTPFLASANGRALYGYLLWQNGLQLKGFETLVSVESPAQVADYLINLWSPLVDVKAKYWQVVERDVSTNWAIRLNMPSMKADAEKWTRAIDLGVKGQADQAAKILSQLLTSGSQVVDSDLMNITAARLLYQNGYLDAAIRYNSKVSRGSDYWYEAQEEAAWAHLRKGETEKALAITKTLIHPDLKVEIGPATVFLHALANLKVCNYPEVAKVLLEFKKRFRAKTVALQSLLTETGAETIVHLLELAQNEPLTTVRVGHLAPRLPRAVGRDQVVANRGLRYGLLLREAARAGELYSQFLQKGSQVGFQGTFEKLRQRLETRAQSTKGAFVNRVHELARAEIKEIGHILQKMHIVEAELIQQTGLADRVAKDTQDDQTAMKSKKGKLAKNEVSFAGDGEIWFDELTHYNFDVTRGCQAK